MLRLDRPALTNAVTSALSRHTRYLDTELHTLRGLVRPGDVCVDVGSAAGLYSQALSHLVGAGGAVHSVEPLTFSHPFWSRVLGARRRGNVHHHAAALGAEPGRAAMRVPFGSRGPATSRSFLDWESHGVGSNEEYDLHADLLVDVLTLDGLCATERLTRLDFVKIDVEGGELHVLTGGAETIARFRPTMLIEIEARHTARYEYSPDDVVSWLTTRGYSMYAWQRGWKATERVCAHANNYLFRPVPGSRPGTGDNPSPAQR
ncbi:FkbM family methyltransferase [Actinoplanes regularis]|uniref:FkbM family methyltransferase n=1 Tax=Actinoplanes regularis TaxID=52697 RepID=UPI0024A3AF1F|nr:FkbM family methyltransferase [Actinoplanes regularis]GLW27194.1 putative methyltransferase [Actinoplanes regularis]